VVEGDAPGTPPTELDVLCETEPSVLPLRRVVEDGILDVPAFPLIELEPSEETG
jgi:hypothetical protein